MALAKEQIKLAFEQSEKEVADLHQRTREGLLTARLNGKQVGRKKGVGFETKKAREAKQIIRTHCKTFGGTLDDAECMKLTGLARNTYYKYKRQIRAELMAEQDLPKGASIFYGSFLFCLHNLCQVSSLHSYLLQFNFLMQRQQH